MLHHEELIFDYEGFEKEVRPLARQIQNMDFTTLNQRIAEIQAKECTYEIIFFAADFARRKLKPIIDINSEKIFSYAIGLRLSIILAQYTQRCKKYMGWSWYNLVEVLYGNHWCKEDVVLFFSGHPTGYLITEEAKNFPNLDAPAEYTDPYWRWVRPYSANGNGGWLGFEECQRLYDKLCQVNIDFSIRKRFEECPDMSDKHKLSFERDTRTVFENAQQIFSEAISSKMGLYMAKFLSCDEEDDEDGDVIEI